MTRSSGGSLADRVFIAACLVLVALAAFKVFWPVQSAGTARAAREDFIARGSVFGADLPGAATDRRPKALVFIHSQCPFCTRNMPLYRDLRLLSEHDRRFGIYFFSFEPENRLVTFLAANGLASAHASSVPLLGRIRGTPSIVVVDGSNRVMASWEGPLTQGQGRELIRELQRQG